MSGTGVAAGISLWLAFLAILVCLLWIFLPFAVFGMKGLLREAIQQQKRTNELLQSLADKRTQQQ